MVVTLGFVQVTKAYNYIHKYEHKSKLMAAAVRNKQDVFSLLGYFTISINSLLLFFVKNELHDTCLANVERSPYYLF